MSDRNDEPEAEEISVSDLPEHLPQESKHPAEIVTQTGMTFIITRRSAVVIALCIVAAIGLSYWVLFSLVGSRSDRRNFVNDVLYNYVCFAQVQNPGDPQVQQARKLIDCPALPQHRPGQPPASVSGSGTP